MKLSTGDNAISTLRRLIVLYAGVTLTSILYGIEVELITKLLANKAKQKLQILAEKLELKKLKGSHSIIELFESYVAHSNTNFNPKKLIP